MSELIFLSNVRLSFPHLAEPQRQQGENGERISYNAEFIMPPDHPGFAQFMQAVSAAALAKWGTNAQNVLNLCQQDRKKRCFGRGEEKVNSKTFQPYDGYPGMVYISAGRNQMPQIIDPQGQAVDPTNTMACQALARKMYGGCYVNAAVKPWLQENKHGRAVRCDLVAVQFFKDGDAFGQGNANASGLFGATSAAAAGDPMPFGVAPQPPAPQMPGVPFPGAQPPAPPAPGGMPPFLQ